MSLDSVEHRDISTMEGSTDSTLDVAESISLSSREQDVLKGNRSNSTINTTALEQPTVNPLEQSAEDLPTDAKAYEEASLQRAKEVQAEADNRAAQYAKFEAEREKNVQEMENERQKMMPSQLAEEAKMQANSEIQHQSEVNAKLEQERLNNTAARAKYDRIIAKRKSQEKKAYFDSYHPRMQPEYLNSSAPIKNITKMDESYLWKPGDGSSPAPYGCVGGPCRRETTSQELGEDHSDTEEFQLDDAIEMQLQ